MLRRFISGLIVALILSAFGVQTIIASFVLQVFNYTLTSAVYYVAFGLVGLVSEVFKRD